MLPPAIAASKTYRCKDNSLVYIDWLSDGTARVKAGQDRRRHSTVKLGEARRGPAQGQRRPTASVTYNGKTCHG